MTSPVSGPSGRRVLIVGADGLRPDLLDPERMPNVAKLIREGVRFTDHHAAYPSHTRVNMSTLATGSAPGRHGIVANTMLVPGATEDHIVDTSNYQHLDALGAAPGPGVLLVRSLSDVLVDAGRRVAVAGTGSSGSNVLWTLDDRGRIVNTNSAYGIADLYDLREKLGQIPERATPAIASNDYATSAVTDLYLDDPRNAVIVLWLAEPDSSLHKFGLGSPESEQAMVSVDQCLGRILEAMDRRGIRDQFDVLFLSDHGHSTVRSHATLREYVGKARADLGSHLPDLATASDYIYARPGTAEPPATELAPLVEWLYAQPWVDIVLAGRDDDAAILPGTIPLSELWGGATNGRRPLLAVSPVWDHSANEFGVPGSVSTLTTQSALHSSHGSLSPYDMHAVMIASGPSFRSGVATDLPTGATDVLPTILSLLDLPVPHTASGRVLLEAIATPGDDRGSHRETTLSAGSVGGRQRQIRLDHVGTTTYVHGSITPSH